MQTNPLKYWAEEHRRKILRELLEAGIDLTEQEIPRILKFTSFAVRSQRVPNECPYYQRSPPKPCHNIPNLNCFLCACPDYNSDNPKGGCKTHSSNGRVYHHPNLPEGEVWDCSSCNKYHDPTSVTRYIRTHLKELQRQTTGLVSLVPA